MVIPETVVENLRKSEKGCFVRFVFWACIRPTDNFNLTNLLGLQGSDESRCSHRVIFVWGIRWCELWPMYMRLDVFLIRGAGHAYFLCLHKQLESKLSSKQDKYHFHFLIYIFLSFSVLPPPSTSTSVIPPTYKSWKKSEALAVL